MRSATVVAALAVALLMVSSLGPWTPPSRAGETETFRLEPHPLKVDGQERRTFRYEIPEGGSVRDGVLLTNKTDEVRRFRVYASDASRHPETGALSIAPYGAEPTGLARWMTVEDPDVGLLPRTQEVVPFTVQRPEDVDSSGRAAIVAEEVREGAEGGGIEVVFRLAILVTLEGAEPSLDVTGPTLSFPVALVPHRAQAAATISNLSLEPVSAEVAWQVESLSGRVWDLGSEEILVGPEETLDLERDWSTVPRWGGVYRTRLDVTTDVNTLAVRGERVASLPLWFLAVVIAVVGIRGSREIWSRRRERGADPPRSAPDPDALRRRLIEAALWLHAAGQDAPRELRETTAAEAQAVAAEARRTKGASDVEQAARSLAVFASGLEDGGGSAQKAAHDFDEWFRQHRDDPSVKELVGT